MSIKLVSTGGGSVTIQEPNTASDFTLSVPAQTANLLTNKTAGTVLQVVSGFSSVQQGSSATSFTETNTTATITPSSTSSKILILLQANFSAEQNSVGNITVYRNGSNIGGVDGMATVYLTASKPLWAGGIFVQHIDEPASTSALTYTAYAKANGGASWNWNWGNTGTNSRITLLEIAG